VVGLLPLVVVPLGLVGGIAAIMWASRCERVVEVDVRVELFRMGIGFEVWRFVRLEAAR
jgi:hypothetical protein